MKKYLLFIILVGVLLLGVEYFKQPNPQRLPDIQGVEITFEDKPEVLKRIIQCESGGNSFAQNPTSIALGIFQIIDSTELFCEKHLGIEIDRTSVNDSWLCAIFLYERYGTEHWVCK